VRELYFQLTYKQHGGSGLNWTPADVDNCEVGEVLWQLDRLKKQREQEARAIEKAHRKK